MNQAIILIPVIFHNLTAWLPCRANVHMLGCFYNGDVLTHLPPTSEVLCLSPGTWLKTGKLGCS